MTDKTPEQIEAERQQRMTEIQSAFANFDIFKLLGFLFNFIFGDDENAPNEGPETAPDSTSSRIRMARQVIDSRALPRWEDFKRAHAGESVSHISPIAESAKVNSPFDPHRMHPIQHRERPHTGADIIAAGHPDIHATAAGVVLFSGPKSGYGNTVIIGHADGTSTLYAHMTGDKMPELGAEVAQNAVIGVLGATGGVTGAHLHYEQRVNGLPVPPHIGGQLLARGTSLHGQAGDVRLASSDATSPQAPTSAPAAHPAHPQGPVVKINLAAAGVRHQPTANENAGHGLSFSSIRTAIGSVFHG